jgi:hypothetical protein
MDIMDIIYTILGWFGISGIIVFIADIILFIKAIKKSNKIEKKSIGIFFSIVTFVGILILSFIFSIKCSCGFPRLGIPALIILGASIILDWILLFKFLKNPSYKHVCIIILLIIIEAGVALGINMVFPENYHQNIPTI